MSLKQVSRLVLLAQLASTVVGLNTPYYGSIGTTQKLEKGDVLYSPDKQHVLSMVSVPVTPYSASFNSISDPNPVPLDNKLAGCNVIRPNNVGQVVGSNCNAGTVTWGTASSKTSANWVLKIDNDGVISTYLPATSNSAAITGNKQVRTIKHWGFEAITGQSPANGMVASRGSGVNVYLIDSGIDATRDWSRGMSTFAGVDDWNNNQNFQKDVGDDYTDYIKHGTVMASIISNRFSGIAPAVNLFNVKITTGTSKNFDEYDLFKAFRKVMDHSTSNAKIINHSIAYQWPSLAMKCAYQKAYLAGVAIVMSAGNDNVKDIEHFGYAMRVGAVDSTGTPYGFTTYGPSVDIWAPGQHVNDDKGTSVAAAYVTGVLAAAISKFPTQLKTDPGRGYVFLRDVALNQNQNNATTFKVQSNDKVTNSAYAAKRFVTTKFGGMTPAPGDLFDSVRQENYCLQLSTQNNLAYPISWEALDAHLSPKPDPHFVDWSWPGPRY